jgi:hypothetical protein
MSTPLTLVLAYLILGLVVSVLLRQRIPEDWGEELLASVLGPPLFALIAAAAIGQFVWRRIGSGRVVR